MKKLKLEDLRVNSFVTEASKSEKQTVQGGVKPTNDNYCYTILGATFECCTGNYPSINNRCDIK